LGLAAVGALDLEEAVEWDLAGPEVSFPVMTEGSTLETRGVSLVVVGAASHPAVSHCHVL